MNNSTFTAKYKNKNLFSKMGKNKYNTKDAPENVIKYILRSEGSSKERADDVLCSGAYGAIDFLGEETTIQQFEKTSKLNTRKNKKNRYIDHQVLSLPPYAESALKNHPELIHKTCSNLAVILSDEEYQVVYALHEPDENNKHYHMHFAVNTVNFRTGLKRQESYQKNAEHEKKMLAYMKRNLYRYRD